MSVSKQINTGLTKVTVNTCDNIAYPNTIAATACTSEL